MYALSMILMNLLTNFFSAKNKEQFIFYQLIVVMQAIAARLI